MQTDSPHAGPSLAGPIAPGLGAMPLFHAAWQFAAGIALTHWLWAPPSLALIALAFVAALCGLAAFHAQRIAWLPMAVLWCLLGAWCAQMEPHPAPAPAVAALSDGLLRTVEGTVVDAGPVRQEIEQSLDQQAATQPPQKPSQRIDLRASTIEVVTDTEDAQAPVEGGVRLNVRWPAPLPGAAVPAAASTSRPLQCGERVRADLRLLLPEDYHDPGVFSRQEYLLDQGVTSTATVNIDRVERLGQSPGLFLSCRIAALQRASSARLLALPAAMRQLPAALRLNQDDAVMLAAMVTGDRTYLTHSLRVGFERTGSFHMLVVSGFHLAIVAGCFLWAARRLRLPRVPATLVTIAASFAYALFTGFATPVQRSLWMVTLYLLGRLIYRERSPMNTIGFAALCLMAASPRSLFDSSLQMTLLAVVAIAGVAAPLLQATLQPYVRATNDVRLTNLDPGFAPHLAQFRLTLRMIASHLADARLLPFAWRIVPWTARLVLRTGELLVVSCVVELAMTLPMALYFHRITFLALPVNVFILPLLLVLMPAALVTLLALALWPPAAVVPAMVVAAFLHLGIGLVRLFGSLAWGDFRIPAPLIGQSLAFCALLAAAMVLARRGSLARRLAWVALSAAALAAVAPRSVDHPHDALLVEAIDVGQGDSLLLITPDGKTLLVDGGGFGGGPRQAPQEFDIGEEVVSQALWARGIRTLDAVALSHAHSDHMGGLPAVLRNFHPAELWVGNNPRSDAYKALLAEAAVLRVNVRTLNAGQGFSFGVAQVNVLAPLPAYKPGNAPANNDSLVLHVAYSATSVLLEGDAEAPVEEAMLTESGLQSTLLKVGHHGSTSSSRPEFLARVAPEWAVISCGLHNRYGHPRQEVLAELESSRVRTLSTDIGGAACFRLDGKNTVPDFACGWRRSP